MRLFVVSIITITLAVGCANTANPGASPSPNNTNHEVRVRQTIPPQQEIKDPEGVAQRLENLARSVPKVKDATCVVFGNTAIIGINVAGNMERARVGTIKYSVAEALRKDPVGVNAIVTADIDIGNRLREMNADIRNGTPINGFAQELADIIGRIMPQFPRDIEPPDDNNDRKQLQNRSL
jgi:YhcN/YlaJ family sporulation lipoprotein